METMTAVLDKKYTVAEYLESEKTADVRHEFHYGKLIEMAGESKQANIIANNILVAWRTDFRKKDYQIFTHDVKVLVKARGIYRYPDLVVAPKADDSDDFIVLQPEILVEVASENSLPTDNGLKLKEYAALPSLQYYLVISQDEMTVRVYAREGAKWTFEILDEPAQVIDLPLFDTQITLADIYADIIFAERKSD